MASDHRQQVPRKTEGNISDIAYKIYYIQKQHTKLQSLGQILQTKKQVQTRAAERPRRSFSKRSFYWSSLQLKNIKTPTLGCPEHFIFYLFYHFCHPLQFSQVFLFFCKTAKSLIHLAIKFTGTQGSVILAFSNIALFLSFQMVQKTTETPVNTKCLSLAPNFLIQILSKSSVSSGMSNSSKAHLIILQSFLAREHFHKQMINRFIRDRKDKPYCQSTPF